MNIAFIPVRGGSKSIPLKNIKNINGKPLVYWTAFAAENANCIDKLVIATDSDEIKAVVKQFGFSKLEIYDRKPENAQDTSTTESVMLEYIYANSIPDTDLFFLIQATSPLLKADNIDDIFREYSDKKCDSMFTGVREKQFHWIENSESVQPINYDYRKRPRRQDFSGIIAENGACYVNLVKNIKKDKCRLSGKISVYEMPSYTSYEIDEPSDWIIIENIMKKYEI